MLLGIGSPGLSLSHTLFSGHFEVSTFAPLQAHTDDIHHYKSEMAKPNDHGLKLELNKLVILELTFLGHSSGKLSDIDYILIN